MAIKEDPFFSPFAQVMGLQTFDCLWKGSQCLKWTIRGGSIMGNMAPLQWAFVVQDKRRNTFSCGNLHVKWRSLGTFFTPISITSECLRGKSLRCAYNVFKENIIKMPRTKSSDENDRTSSS